MTVRQHHIADLESHRITSLILDVKLLTYCWYLGIIISMRDLNYNIIFVFICVIFLNVSMQVKSAEPVAGLPLSLNCFPIPIHKDQLCTVKTISPYGPYDDVVFYRKTEQNELFLLGNQKGGVATFAGIGFSEQGVYMWISWAEEGHPSFGFYKTAIFLEGGLATEMLDSLDDYAFDEFVGFSDDGKVSYSRQKSMTDDCSHKPCIYNLYLKH